MIFYFHKRRKFALFLKALFVLLFSFLAPAQTVTAQAAEQSNVVVNYVDAAKARALIASDLDIIVLDVRTKGEYKRGHIKGAVLNNYFSFNFKKRLRALDRNKHYIVHCKSGHRSQGAVKKMIKEGFTHITHLDGGYDAWKKLPAENVNETP